MKFLPHLACGLLILARTWAADGIVLTRAEDEVAAPVAQALPVDGLRLTAMLQGPGQFMLIVSLDGSVAQRIHAIGAKVGTFELVGFDFTQEYADFKSQDGIARRIWLPKGTVKTGRTGATILIPPLSAMKGVIGLEEAQADARARGRDVAGVEKRTLFGIERQINDPKLSLDERGRLLADLISGKLKHILCPPGGIDAAFAEKYGLTPETVASANWGETAGMAMMQRAKPAAAAAKP